MTIKAILFDYLGTLVQPQNYSMQNSKAKLHQTLCEAGLKTDLGAFMESYAKAHEKYRIVRYEQLREVTNTVWVSEALCNVNCRVSVDDSRLKAGLNEFFKDFISTLRLRVHAKQLLKEASYDFKVGLISNFTYAPAIYASLRKLRINKFFSVVVVSEKTGWRKPHKIIFNQALRGLDVRADEAVFVGDSPQEDIQGASDLGMRTVFVPSQFNTLDDLEKSGIKPDLVVVDLQELCMKLPELPALVG